MNLNEYQDWVESVSTERTSAKNSAVALAYAGLGIAGEAGEVLQLDTSEESQELVKKCLAVTEHIKKMHRKGEDSSIDTLALVSEIGDIFWYAAKLCNLRNIHMEDVLIANVDKINDRRLNGKK